MTWGKARLGDVADSCLGKMLDKDKNKGTPQPYLANVNVRWGSFDLENLSLMRFEDHEQDRYGLKYGDLIVCEGGEPGRCAIWKDEIPNMKIQKALHRVRVREGMDHRYLFYWFLHAGKRGVLDQYFTGATIKHMPGDKLKTIEIDKPPLDVQKRIADVLSAYDDLIENNRKQIRLLEEATRRLYKEWFIDLRFPGHENTPIIDGVPEGWKRCSIIENDVFDYVRSNVNPFDGEKVYYATADVNGTFITGRGEIVTFEKRPSRAAVQPKNESVWFARMSNSYKILCCYGASSDLAENSIISSGFAGFTSRKNCFGFVYNTIASEQFNEKKNCYATGATQVSLTNEGLRRIRLLLPTLSLIETYSMISEPYILKMEALKRQITLLTESRNMLLPKLLSEYINN